MVWNKVHNQVQRSKLIVAKYVQNVRLWLKHKLASVSAIGQLHQSATAPGCTTQLCDVRGLPILIRWSSELVSCNFLNKFSIPLRFQFLSEIPEWVAEHRSLLIPIFLKIKTLSSLVIILFRWCGQRCIIFVANLFRKQCNKFRQNRPSFIENITKKHFGLFFSGHNVQVGQLSQTHRAAGWVSFGKNISGRRIVH